MTRPGWRRCAVALLLMLALPAHARPPVYGWVERVELRFDERRVRLKAKLDTGARSASLHATDIERFERDGREYVRFTVPLEDEGDAITLERPLTRSVRIKRHRGPYDRRPVVRLPMCLGEGWHEVEVSLTDRSRFIYPLLLGRRALAGYALVDPDHTHLRPADCED